MILHRLATLVTVCGITCCMPALCADAEPAPAKEQPDRTEYAATTPTGVEAGVDQPVATDKPTRNRAQKCQQLTGSKIRPRSDKDCEGRIDAAYTAVKPTLVDRAMHPK